jgi:hypothetical protein
MAKKPLFIFAGLLCLAGVIVTIMGITEYRASDQFARTYVLSRCPDGKMFTCSLEMETINKIIILRRQLEGASTKTIILGLILLGVGVGGVMYVKNSKGNI